MLPGVEVVVAASGGIKLLMSAPLDDLPLFDDQDLISTADGGKPMGDHKRSPPLHEICKAVLDHLLRFRVEAGCRFIQNEDAWLRENGARDRDTLPLAPGKLHATLAHDGLILVGEGFGEFIDPRDAASAQDFVFTGVGTGKRHILPNGSIKEKGFLQH